MGAIQRQPWHPEVQHKVLDASFVLRADGRLLQVSAPLRQLLGVAQNAAFNQFDQILDEATQAQQVLQWLRASAPYACLSVPLHAHAPALQPPHGELLLTALPARGLPRAHCVLRLAGPDGELLGTQRVVMDASELQHAQAHCRDLVRGQTETLLELHRYQAALEESEFRWKFALEGSGQGVWDWDVASDLSTYSAQWLQVLGYASAPVLSTTPGWSTFVHPMDLGRMSDALQACLSGATPRYACEFRMCKRDGSTVWVHSRGMVVGRGGAGEPLRLIATLSDITQRKAMEMDLRVAAVAFESPVSMMILNAHGVIERVNQAFIDATGYGASAAAGRTLEFLQSGTYDAAFYATLWRTVEQNGKWEGEVWGRRNNGAAYLKWMSIACVRDGAGQLTHYVASDLDITGRRKAEEALKRMNRSLDKKKAFLRALAAKNEATRENERKHIAREVHDELGQVLTALRMDTTLIRMRFGGLTPELDAKVGDMRSLVDQAIQGVRNVASRLRPAVLDMGLHPALEWLCAEFAQRAGIPCQFDSSFRELALDEARAVVVFRIVQESLTNVSRYANATQVRVILLRKRDSLVVEVQDNGCGFVPELVSQRAQSFGLRGMQERAISLDGRINIISAPGSGTTIAMLIPYLVQDAEIT